MSKRKTMCSWYNDSDVRYVFGTECKRYFGFKDSGPTENGFNFCPFCGKKIELLTVEDDDDLIAEEAPTYRARG